MSDASSFPSALNILLRQRVPAIPLTWLLIGINLLVFLAMLANGAGFWSSSNTVQLAWGANFGPATQDGQWWRLGSALFLHFGIVHLVLNMLALWDSGQFVERMYGHVRFIGIYFISGLSGNLLSLVTHHGTAVSGGASGAIFGVYGALLTFMLREQRNLPLPEFRLLFWGALVFSAATIAMGFIIPGIDNAAHIGGFVAGILSSIVLARPLHVAYKWENRRRLAAAMVYGLALVVMIKEIPAPAYRWHDEVQLRKEIGAFLRKDQAINRSWLDIVNESKQGNTSFDELAGQIDNDISDRYEESFEQLSKLPPDPDLPSAQTVKELLQYTERRKNASHALAEKLRAQPERQVPPAK